MAKKANAKAKLEKVVQKVLDSTELDEKIIAEYNEHKSTYDLVLCYINCYGAYVTAVGSGCMFGVNNWIGLGLLAVTAGWAWYVVCKCKPCKGGVTGSCCK